MLLPRLLPLFALGRRSPFATQPARDKWSTKTLRGHRQPIAPPSVTVSITYQVAVFLVVGGPMPSVPSVRSQWLEARDVVVPPRRKEGEESPCFAAQAKQQAAKAVDGAARLSRFGETT